MCDPIDAIDNQRLLEAADRVARAAYLWMRHGHVRQVPYSGQRMRQDVIAGLIVGLCNALELDDRHALMSAYAFALIDGDAADALPIAQSMVRRRDDERFRAAYQDGLTAADDLVALISAPEGGPLPN